MGYNDLVWHCNCVDIRNASTWKNDLYNRTNNLNNATCVFVSFCKSIGRSYRRSTGRSIDEINKKRGRKFGFLYFTVFSSSYD
jgi:hypothetical protein